MKRFLKGLGIFLLIAILAGLCASALGYCDFSQYKDDIDGIIENDEGVEGEEAVEGEDVTADAQSKIWASNSYSDGTVMTMSATTLSSTDTAGVTLRLTATVTPVGSEVGVIWDVQWADGAELEDEDLSDYLTISPVSDTYYCDVTAIQSFRDSNIVITVMTEDANYMATCVAIYEGIASEITIVADQYLDNSVYELPYNLSGDAGELNLTISVGNIFNDVGSDYTDWTYEVFATGTVVLDNLFLPDGYGSESWLGSESLVSLSTMIDDFISVERTGNVITVTSLNHYNYYYGSSSYTNYSGWTYYNSVKEASGCKFGITITQSDSGLSETIYFDLCLTATGVEGVSLDNSNLTF